MLTPGDRIQDKYRVIRPIGEGGMGAVFECEYEAIKRHVAIKVLFPQFAVDPEAVLRFHREAQAAGKIGQDNICEIVDIGQLANGAPYLVMPLLKGEPLSDIIRHEAPLDLGRAVDLTSQVLDALAAAHQAGIVHRDLKPDNLFVTRLGSRNIEFVKVLDFGISKVLGNTAVDEHKQVTRTGMVMGTPCYMAPEQARGLKDVDHRADLYAVGTILYELVTGRRPFEGESFNDILIRVVIDPVLSPRQLRADLPPELEALIVAAMDRDKLQRPQTADEFRIRLQAAWETEKGTAAQPRAVARTESAPAAAAVPAVPRPRNVSSMQSVGPVPALSTVRGAAGPTGQGGESLVPPRSRKALFLGVGGAAIVVLAVAAFVVLGGRKGSGAPPAPSTVAAVPGIPTGTPPPAPPAVANAEAAPGPLVVPPPAVEPAAPIVPPPAIPSGPDAGAPAETTVDAGPAIATVRIVLSGVPAGGVIEVAGSAIEGTSTELPRSDRPVTVAVTARGYDRFTANVVPSEDRTVPVRMRRSTSGATRVGSVNPPPPADAGSALPPGRDAATVSGRLGTTLINIYGEDAP